MIQAHVKFERGKSPKTQMDVGARSSDEMQRTIKKYNAISRHLQHCRNLGDPKINQSIDDLWRSRPRRLVTTYGWANMHDMFEKLTEDEYLEIYPVIDKWHKELEL